MQINESPTGRSSQEHPLENYLFTNSTAFTTDFE